MTVRKFLGLGAGLLCLTACGGEPAAPAAPAVPAAPATPVAPAAPAAPAVPKAMLNGVDLDRPVRALGTEPFWAVDLDAQRRLVLTGVDRPETVASNLGVTVNGARAELAGQVAGGRTLKLVLTPGPCSDGMSDRTYPLTAVVSFGTETLKGCAASTEALARAGESGEVR